MKLKFFFHKPNQIKIFITTLSVLMGLVGHPLNSNAQRTSVTIPVADWEVYLEDSLILTGNLESKYTSRPLATIDIDNKNHLKKMTFIFNICKAFEPRIDIKEKDSTLFVIIGYNHIGDTLIIERDNRPGYYVTNFRRIKGKTVQLYYRNEGFQKTPTLLGTLIIKKD